MTHESETPRERLARLERAVGREGEREESCVWENDECGPVVMWDASGEPWCQNCMDRVRAEDIAAGLNDPERPLQ